MRYEVPQFIDIEDKIFGPLTFKQALYIAGSAGLSFMIYYGIEKFVPVDLGGIVKLIFASPPLAIGLAFAFIKVNKRPFIKYVEALFYFFVKPKRYVWSKKQHNKSEKKDIVKKQELESARIDKQYVPNITRSKLKDLAWTLDMDTEK
ncbi:hypothetical protein CSB11_02570 [Candidatus Campbellbacteria bacterium]|nr:MAG: hypothetical protein CSB11_02570 [Candidatus Campbellbacteria bacterium]